jgi:hypothetical protein
MTQRDRDEERATLYERQAAFYAAQAQVPHTAAAVRYFKRLAAELRAELAPGETQPKRPIRVRKKRTAEQRKGRVGSKPNPAGYLDTPTIIPWPIDERLARRHARQKALKP